MIRNALAAAAIVMLAAPASARLTSCSVGQRVKAPGGPATVVATQGSACTVKVDGRSTTGVFAAFMLDPLPGAAPPQSPATDAATQPADGAVAVSMPKPGAYQCFGGAAGNLKLFMLGGNAYANEQDVRGTFATGRNGQIKFVSGAWAGFYGKVLPNGRFGLTSVEGRNNYSMTCDPKS